MRAAEVTDDDAPHVDHDLVLKFGTLDVVDGNFKAFCIFCMCSCVFILS